MIEVNLSPSFANDTNLDDELKRGVVTDGFRLLNATYREKIRKINRKREDMQKRIVERTSYKDNLQKKKEELEKIKKKRENYERKNMGNYRLAFPNPNEEIQAKYMEYLNVSMNNLAFPSTKSNGTNKNKVTTIDTGKERLKKTKSSTYNDQIPKKAKEPYRKPQKSPYEMGSRRIITSASSKQHKRGNASNPKYQ